MPRPKAWLGGERWDGVPRALWSADVDVPIVAKAIYAYFCSIVSEDLQAFPSQEMIMAAVNVRSDNTVRSALKALRRANMLELLLGRTRKPDGTWTPPTYRLAPPRDWVFFAEPPLKSAEGPSAKSAEGPSAKSAVEPPLKSAADQEKEVRDNARAPAREAAARASLPQLPVVKWGGQKLEKLWGFMWDRAAKSAGAVRIQLKSGLNVDVFCQPRSLVVWRDTDLDSGRYDFSRKMKAWNDEIATFWRHVFGRNDEPEEAWTKGAAPGYPLTHIRYVDRGARARMEKPP